MIADHILGAFVALIYVAIIGSIIWWMLHVPKVGDVEQHARRIIRQEGRFKRIVVPVQGDVLSDRLVALGSQMARFRGASMEVLYVIEVPLTLPLGATMDDQERQARDAFLRASRITDKYDVRITTRVERARKPDRASSSTQGSRMWTSSSWATFPSKIVGEAPASLGRWSMSSSTRRVRSSSIVRLWRKEGKNGNVGRQEYCTHRRRRHG